MCVVLKVGFYRFFVYFCLSFGLSVSLSGRFVFKCVCVVSYLNGVIKYAKQVHMLVGKQEKSTKIG